jgi:hypothetical protein
LNFTISEAAKELEVSKWTVRNYIKQGKLNSRLISKGKMSVRTISKEDIELFKNPSKKPSKDIDKPMEKTLANREARFTKVSLGLLEQTYGNYLGKSMEETLVNLASNLGKVEILEKDLKQTREELKQTKEDLKKAQEIIRAYEIMPFVPQAKNVVDIIKTFLKK